MENSHPLQQEEQMMATFVNDAYLTPRTTPPQQYAPPLDLLSFDPSGRSMSLDALAVQMSYESTSMMLPRDNSHSFYPGSPPFSAESFLTQDTSAFGGSSTDDTLSPPPSDDSRRQSEDLNHKAQRRRAQNRAAQRAYRQRKDQSLRELEHEVEQLRTELEQAKQDNLGLCKVVSVLEEKLKHS